MQPLLKNGNARSAQTDDGEGGGPVHQFRHGEFAEGHGEKQEAQRKGDAFCRRQADHHRHGHHQHGDKGKLGDHIDGGEIAEQPGKGQPDKRQRQPERRTRRGAGEGLTLFPDQPEGDGRYQKGVVECFGTPPDVDHGMPRLEIQGDERKLDQHNRG